MKKRRNDSIVKGKSIKDIMSIDPKDILKMSRKELSTYTSRLASAANKRLKRMYGKEKNKFEYKDKFSVKDKNINQLRAEYARAKSYLQSNNSLSGMKKTKKKVINGLKKQGVKITGKQYNKFWSVYKRLKEVDPKVSSYIYKYMSMRDVADYINDNPTKNIDEVIDGMMADLNSHYEEQKEQEDDEGFSEFFDDK